MRAIVLTRAHRVELVDDWPEPDLGPDEVVVEMSGVGVCGSDLGVYRGERVPPRLPWVMGHEGGGEIVAVGSRISDRAPGQRVVIEPNYCCLHCRACSAGLTSSCPNRRIVGMESPGLLAERVAVPARFTWPVPDETSDATLACIEPFAVSRAAVRRSGVRAGDRCLVVGAGSQGLLVCQYLRALGVHPFVSEPNENRLAFAETLGAERARFIQAADYTFVFDTVGTGQSWRTSLDAAADAGFVMMIGMSPESVHLSTKELVRRQLKIKGTLIYDHPDDFRDSVAMVTAGEVRPDLVLCGPAEPQHAGRAFEQASSMGGKSWISLAEWRKERTR